MSYITNVLVKAPADKIEELNEWLREHDERDQQLRLIDMDAAGGTKYYTGGIWAAAFNYGPMGEFLPKLRDPETWGTAVLMVAVLIDGEEEMEAFVFEKVDGEYAPVTRQEWRG